MKRALVLVGGLAVLALVAMPAQAGGLSDVIVALHLQPHVNKGNCNPAQAGFACDAVSGTSTINSTGPINAGYDVLVVMVDVDTTGADGGTLGLEFGLSFDGTAHSGADAFNTVLCTDGAEFSGLGWPNSGGVNTITYITCENVSDPTDNVGHIGMAVPYAIYVYAYGADLMCIVPKQSGIFGATDCSNTGWDLNPNYPANAGCAGFGRPGNDPCAMTATPVEETTWGNIKEQFSNQ